MIHRCIACSEHYNIGLFITCIQSWFTSGDRTSNWDSTLSIISQSATILSRTQAARTRTMIAPQHPLMPFSNFKLSLASWPSFPWHSTQRRWAISASNPFLLLPLLTEMRLSIVQSLQGLGAPLVWQIRCPLSYTTRLLCPSAAAGTLVLCLRSGSRVHKPLYATSPWRHRNFYRFVFSRTLCLGKP